MTSQASYSQLHPKNPYFKKPPDFLDLRNRYPELLSAVVTHNPYLPTALAKVDWTNPLALHAITKVLLKHDFQIEWSGLDGHLCPPLPNRLNYLCWLSDLLTSCQSLWPHGQTMHVVDIGVGANAIYPLLGARVFGWDFSGSDINSAALQHASSILQANPLLAQRIRLFQVPACHDMQQCIEQHMVSLQDVGTAAQSLLHALHHEAEVAVFNTRGPVRQLMYAMGGVCAQRLADCEHFVQQQLTPSDRGRGRDNRGGKKARRQDDDEEEYSEPTAAVVSYSPLISAVMTNPPFYNLQEHIQPISDEAELAGSSDEMRTKGGELAFIAAMIADSLILRDSVLWYTAMVGKKSSIAVLRAQLLAEGLKKEQIILTTFMQGITYRWAIAWTFSTPAAVLAHTHMMLVAPAEQANVQTFSLELSFDTLHATSMLEELSVTDGVQRAAHRFQLLLGQMEGILRQQHYYHDYMPNQEQSSFVTSCGVVQAKPWQISVVVASSEEDAMDAEDRPAGAELACSLHADLDLGNGQVERQLMLTITVHIAQSDGNVKAVVSMPSIHCPGAFARCAARYVCQLVLIVCAVGSFQGSRSMWRVSSCAATAGGGGSCRGAVRGSSSDSRVMTAVTTQTLYHFDQFQPYRPSASHASMRISTICPSGTGYGRCTTPLFVRNSLSAMSSGST